MYNITLDIQALDQPITLAEIEKVITQLPNGKTSGPDGFTFEFYKAFKAQILLDLLAIFQHVTLVGALLFPLNNSYTLLIPKNKSTILPGDFGPISVVHGVQKIFSKVLANRL
jgi:hypothetical protein